MRPGHPLERAVGIEYYVSDADGTGGRLRANPADFRVQEIEAFEAEPIDADADAYPHLLLRVELRNWETNDFASTLASHLGISRERVSWAGTKDKRAVTTQLFTVDGIAPTDLPDLPRADCEVVGRTGRPILFGDLAGNEFAVTIRDPDRPKNAPEITAQLATFGGAGVKEKSAREVAGGDDPVPVVGVPNFFGHQRFGSTRPVTHEVGLAIVRREWEEAVLAYVGNPHEREREDTREARAYVEETRDWAGALERYPTYLGYERSMLHRLTERADDPVDFRAALKEVPSNLQRLFVHAAQSYAYNLMLSERLARGLPFDRPVAGDIVCFADTDIPGAFDVPDQDRTQRVTPERVETVTRHCRRGRAFVTGPLVGTETTLAGGEPGDIEQTVLDEVGIQPSTFDLPEPFDSTGTRRAILVSTALELDRDPLRASFRLPRGSYATVLLREYLKTHPESL